MVTLEDMRSFVTVVALGSFTAAAERLQNSKALASKYLAQLEARFGVRLLNSSTRRLHTTEAGRACHERCLRTLEALDELEAALREGRDEPLGTLSLAAPQTFGERFVSDAAAAFLQAWPKVEIALYCPDRYVNIVEEEIDLAVRIGDLEDSSLVARRLGAVHLVTCAAPAHVARRGKPAVPAELSHHDCVRDRNFRRGARWPLTKDGRTVDVAIKGRLTVNGITAAHRATLAGAGIGLLASYIVEEDIAQGRLARA
jgi:DNA-binding transcriptional LysR family regulator